MILNAFSINMLGAFPANVAVSQLTLDEARALASGLASAVGHPDTAAVFATTLGVPVPMNRATVRLAPGDVALVGQMIGPRLAEGATSLPEGASIVWFRVTVS